MGGWSAEREVSLVSGAAVAEALEQSGHQVTRIDVRRDLEHLLAALTPRPDVVFNALHGRGGEDGCVQGVLEFLGLPYTHSGVAGSAVAMNKAMTKALLASAGVRSPRGLVMDAATLAIGHPMEPPYIVKPVDEGSTVGLILVRAGDPPPGSDGSGIGPGTDGRALLVEEFIPGVELTVGVMGDRALAVTEIRFEGGVFDYDAKYKGGRARHVLPAEIPQEIYDESMRLAKVAHLELKCSGVSRSDFRYDLARRGLEGLFFLETNTQPGMTPLSLVPEQAQFVGMSYRELVGWLVETAECHL